MPWILLHQTWQIYPQSIKHRCLEYHYTKLGRSTGRSIPHQLSIDALNTATPNLADLLADLSPNQLSIDALNTSTQTWQTWQIYPPSVDRCLEWILLYQTWQIYWQIYPPSIKHRCLEYWYTKLGRSTPSQLSVDALNTTTLNLADLMADLPPSIEHRCLKTENCYTKLGTWQIYPHPHQLSIDALNTATPNLADLPPVN